jgi:RNA polymerase sigma factor (sigma-70 family)
MLFVVLFDVTSRFHYWALASNPCHTDPVFGGFTWLRSGRTVSVKQDAFTREAFSRFVESVEPRLLKALIASAGPDAGRDATADALLYAWKNWDRVRGMENPAGYLYRVGRSCVRRYHKRSVLFPAETSNPDHWIEPGLGVALERLTERQRTAILLVEGYDWTYQEVAEVMGLSRSSVQRHVERGMVKLRHALEVTDVA